MLHLLVLLGLGCLYLLSHLHKIISHHDFISGLDFDVFFNSRLLRATSSSLVFFSLRVLGTLKLFLEGTRHDLLDGLDAGFNQVGFHNDHIFSLLFLALLGFLDLLLLEFLLRELLLVALLGLRLPRRLPRIRAIGTSSSIFWLVSVFGRAGLLAFFLAGLLSPRFTALSTAVGVLAVALIDACGSITKSNTRGLGFPVFLCRAVCEDRLGRIEMLAAGLLVFLGHRPCLSLN